MVSRRDFDSMIPHPAKAGFKAVSLAAIQD